MRQGIVDGVESTVFRVWAVREGVELEAADHFAHLACDLRAVFGREDELARLAMRASQDEQRHATLCRKILRMGDGCESPAPMLGASLGPATLALKARILYAGVALSCITETLSTALLIDMQEKALPGPIRDTVHEILEDEISHSRLGWAVLARAANEGEGSVGWLSHYIPFMLAEALESDLTSTLPPSALTKRDLSPWGILPSHRSKEIMLRTLDEVVFPGLNRFGIGTEIAGFHARKIFQKEN